VRQYRIVPAVGPAVLVFTRDGDLIVFAAVSDAAAWMESIDVLDGEYEAVFTLDGTVVVGGGAVDGPVSLTVTGHSDLPGLRHRPHRGQQRAGFRCSADDPVAVANELLRQEWEYRGRRRPRRLARRRHGDTPPTVHLDSVTCFSA
jgi:hypothetical protein